MKINIEKILINKINRSDWWHVPPQDPQAYSKRGKFLASTYRMAEFYGRPNNIPERVCIRKPIYGFSEKEILMKLFPNRDACIFRYWEDLENACYAEDRRPNMYQKRIALDAKIFKKAKLFGYDAIVLITPMGKGELERNRKPRSIELNLLYA